MEDGPAESSVDAGSRSAIAGSNSSSELVVVISPIGDVVLDVLFETSREVIKGSLKTARVIWKESDAAAAAINVLPRSELRMTFRVETAALKKHSRYFANLLSDNQFQEARAVEAGLAALALDKIDPADADIDRLPRVHINDDDEGSHTAGRNSVFTELLRILHWDGTVTPVATITNGAEIGDVMENASPLSSPKSTKASSLAKMHTKKPQSPRPTASGKEKKSLLSKEAKSVPVPMQPRISGSQWSAKTPPTILELATLARQADRFACTEAVAGYVRALRLRLPQAVIRATRIGDASATGSALLGASSAPCMANEEAIRQKVFVSWLLDQPIRFHAGTRELVLFGSRQWKAALKAGGTDLNDGDAIFPDTEPTHQLPAWWDLPNGIESEIQFRRACIVNCIASVPRHFLALYTSRNKRQCKMGYESSAACDSFQLGEIVKFLYHKDLMFLHDFSSTVMSRGGRDHCPVSPADYAAVDVNHILATLRQCPAYQLDKHHVNCGLRTRILPILEYIQAMLQANVVGLHRHEWSAVHHGKASWLAAAEAAGLLDENGPVYDYNEDSDDDETASDGSNIRVPNFGKPPSQSGTAKAADPHAPSVFRFTRSLAGDPRLRMEGSMAADRMARQLFTARRWNWTPES
ncbi:hypothetical protein SEPCBS57363_000778 [Sporothrix epigloea]|uniref:Uncharacterized protein n=1 Tax=Sporothrix epigloea TaxID=1892477 RepID=A0ABP0D6N6_9PEZI